MIAGVLRVIVRLLYDDEMQDDTESVGYTHFESIVEVTENVVFQSLRLFGKLEDPDPLPGLLVFAKSEAIGVDPGAVAALQGREYERNVVRSTYSKGLCVSSIDTLCVY